MKIERPNWLVLLHTNASSHIDTMDTWFDKHVTPINDILAKGVEVYGCDSPIWVEESGHEPRLSARSALLINIQPIKQDTYDSVLKNIVDNWGRGKVSDADMERGRALIYGDHILEDK